MLDPAFALRGTWNIEVTDRLINDFESTINVDNWTIYYSYNLASREDVKKDR